MSSNQLGLSFNSPPNTSFSPFEAMSVSSSSTPVSDLLPDPFCSPATPGTTMLSPSMPFISKLHNFGLSSNEPASTASHETLLRAGNSAHTTLFHRFLELQTENRTLKTSFNTLVSTLHDRLSTPTTPSVSNASISSSTILTYSDHDLLRPLLRDNYPNAKYWYRADFEKDDVGHITTTNHEESPITKTPFRENKQARFMETEKGETVDGETAHQVRQSARHIFTYLASKGHVPSKWTGADVEAITYFRVQMYTQYPELRLCHQHWKVNKIASSVYPEWRRTYTRNQEHQAVKKEKPSDIDAHQHTQTAQKRTRSLSPTSPRKSVTANTEPSEVPAVQQLQAELSLSTGENVGKAPVYCPPSPSAPSTSLEMHVNDPTPSLSEGNIVGAPSVSPALSVLSLPSLAALQPPPSATSQPPLSATMQPPSLATMQPPSLAMTQPPSLAMTQPPHQPPSFTISPIPASSSDHLSTNRPRQKLKIINSIHPSVGNDALSEAETMELAVSQMQGATDTVSETTGKFLRPGPSFTPRNLYLIDYIKTHGNITAKDYAKVWKDLGTNSPQTVEEYKTRSKELKTRQTGASSRLRTADPATPTPS